MKLLTYDDVSGILPRGGTVLGTTNRDNPFKFAHIEKDGSVTYTDESVEATALRGKIGNGGYTRDLIYGVLGSSENSSAISKQTNNPYGNEVRYHKVKSGETIVTIAHKRGVSVEQIIRLNHLGKNQSVRPGQILRYS